MSQIVTRYIWMVTYLHRNVTIVRGVSYHLLGSRISWDSKIRFWLQIKSYISNWRFSKSQHLASYVTRHNAMVYDSIVKAFCLRYVPYLLLSLRVYNMVLQSPVQLRQRGKTRFSPSYYSCSIPLESQGIYLLTWFTKYFSV